LTVVRNEVELEVLAGEIPENIQLDLGAAEMGDTLNLSAITLPEGAKSVIDRDIVIASIAEPRGVGADDEDEDGEEVAADEVPTTGDDDAEE